MRYILLILLFCSCSTQKKQRLALFNKNKEEYTRQLKQGEISQCDYSDLMLGNYELFYTPKK